MYKLSNNTHPKLVHHVAFDCLGVESCLKYFFRLSDRSNRTEPIVLAAGTEAGRNERVSGHLPSAAAMAFVRLTSGRLFPWEF